jgi:hypothetical protein
MPKRSLAVLTLTTVAILIACGSSNDTPTTPVSKIVTFKATLLPTTEVPPTNSSGSGTFVATLDTSTNVFTYDVTFTGLTSNVTLGHIHGPSSATATASPILNFATLPGATFTTGATAGTAHGSTTLTAATQITTTVNGDSLKTLLFAGLTYANVHTTQNGGGEIRGQILKQ